MTKARDLADLGNKTSLDEINDAYDAGALSNRNLIINGAMAISQRNGTSATSVSSGANTYGLDRFFARIQGSSGAATQQQVSDSPDVFSNSVKFTVTSADTNLSSGDYNRLHQEIEGNTISRLGWGTSSAKPVTLSFWVKGSVTGIYSIGIYNGDVGRSIVQEYTITSSNVWEYKTISIIGETSGVWANDNSAELRVSFSLGAGSSFSTSSVGVWQNAFNFSSSNNVNIMATAGATFQITGVQLEVGDTATPFEHRSYGEELAKCQRYCYVFKQENSQYGGLLTFANAYSSSNVQGGKPFPVPMRAKPTLTFTGNIQLSEGTNLHNSSATSVLGNGSSVDQLHFWIGNFSGLTTNQGYFGNMQVSGQVFIADAEL